MIQYLRCLATFKYFSYFVVFWGTSAGTLAASHNNCPAGQMPAMYLLALCSLSTAVDIVNSFDSSCVNNFLDFTNRVLILIYVLGLIPPSKWFKCELRYANMYPQELQVDRCKKE